METEYGKADAGLELRRPVQREGGGCSAPLPDWSIRRGALALFLRFLFARFSFKVFWGLFFSSFLGLSCDFMLTSSGSLMSGILFDFSAASLFLQAS
jgi:hypothetical protein